MKLWLKFNFVILILSYVLYFLGITAVLISYLSEAPNRFTQPPIIDIPDPVTEGIEQ